VEYLEEEAGVWTYTMELPDAQRLPGVAAALAKTVIDNGRALYALHPETRDLETIFRQINTIKKPASGGSAHAA